MKVSFDAFVNWAEDRFGDIVISGNEVKLNSIFAEDTKFHMWCSPHGGKYHRDGGVYHCWKTDNKGTLIGLVMEVDGCAFGEAKQILSGQTLLGELEDILDEFFANQNNEPSEDKGPLQLPEGTYWIDALSGTDKIIAESYLKERKLSNDGLMYCKEGNYKNRIVIPYYDKEGKLIYFNCRDLGNSKIRYMGPPKEVGVGKTDVIFARHWPANGSKIHLTEGELDAISLNVCGLNGMACGGKSISDKQIDFIKDYVICLSFDSDTPGFNGMISVGKKLLQKQHHNLTYVRPPKGFKDWNKMLTSLDENIILRWITENEKKFDEWTIENWAIDEV